MCVIAVKKKGLKMFSKKNIKLMFQENPHGAGVAYVDEELGKVVMKKGFMNLKDLQNYLDTIPNPEEKDLVIHFRITTSGGTSQINCHPYPLWCDNNFLEGEFDAVMFHNGMLDSIGFRGEKEGMNDTQVFIRDCINKLPHNFLKNEATVNLLKIAIGYNKLCFLSKKGITMIGDFTEEKGYFYSNMRWKPWTAYNYGNYHNLKNFKTVYGNVSLYDDDFNAFSLDKFAINKTKSVKKEESDISHLKNTLNTSCIEEYKLGNKKSYIISYHSVYLIDYVVSRLKEIGNDFYEDDKFQYIVERDKLQIIATHRL